MSVMAQRIGSNAGSNPDSVYNKSRPQVYLAGPFTQHLVYEGDPDGLGDPKGSIGPDSRWRRVLQATAQALEAVGWSVFLPHRDVSAWGDREIGPGVVADECLQAVMASDVVVALMAESFGTHVEVGAALGCGVPTVVVRSTSSTESFFASGVASSSWVGELVVSALDELPGAVRSEAFRKALDNATTARRQNVGGMARPLQPSRA